MKLIINYDFFDAIKDARGTSLAMKVIRNNKATYSLEFPFFYALNYATGNDFVNAMTNICFTYGILICINMSAALIAKTIVLSPDDIFTVKAKRRLSLLPSQLSDINVRTNYDKLLESQLYARKYKVQLNEDKIPSLIEKKFVLVPSYNFGGEETETSIMQEHVVGSHEYVLSVDEYKQEKRRVLVPNNG